jgi:hypothetical protein
MNYDMKIVLNKIYYKYFNKNCINNYRLLILTEEYINIGKNYFNKYPTAKGWINLNKELFESNKQAEIDYNILSKRQSDIKKEFFNNQEIMCKETKNKDYFVCSDFFNDFYVSKKYHYEQNTDIIIDNIIKDIKLEN